MDRRKQYGTSGETCAADFLTQKGVHIVERNYRSRFGEIDLIGYEGECLLVIEVKRRRSLRQGAPGEAVDFKKRRKICFAFNDYRMRHAIHEFIPVRFDVVEVYKEGVCRWIKNAFEYVGE